MKHLAAISAALVEVVTVTVDGAFKAPRRRAALARLARANGLVATGGSDFHHPGDALRPGDTGRPPLPPDAIDHLLSDTVRP